MDNKIVLDEKYLDEILKMASIALVGELMKRFDKFIKEEDNSNKTVDEIIRDFVLIKKTWKELTYEKFRELRAVLRAYGYGCKFTIAPKTK